MIKIRNYKDEDFKMIVSWWRAAGLTSPTPSMMPEESTFVLEWQGAPLMCLSAYETNTKSVAFIEGAISTQEPKYKLIKRELAPQLWKHATDYLKNKGFERVIITTGPEALVKRYEQLGFTKIAPNQTVLMKELR